MAVSIREIAQRAGVSPGTVSHVLNGRAAARISEATQNHVRSIAAELGYQPNRLARSLWRKRTDTLGLMVSGLRNPFFVELMEAGEEAIRAAGYQVLVDSAPSVRGTYYSHQPIQNWPVDGALAWTNPDQTVTSFSGPAGELIPTVYLGYPRTDHVDWVGFDLQQGAEVLARYLLDRFGSPVGYVSAYCDEKLRGESRYRTFCRIFQDAGVGLRLFNTQDEEETRAAALQLGMQIGSMPASERPRCIVCHNDVLAIGLISGLKRKGLRIPVDIAVCGFDGIEEGLYLAEPLTTVHTDPRDLARVAVEVLIHRLANPEESGRQSALLPCRLRLGGTT